MSAQLQLQFPVYGAAFQDDDHFIVAGGGGEGNNGIPNKVSRVKIGGGKGKPTVNIIDELEYKGDSATGLVVNGKDSIIVGINDISENIKIGENKHLRKFKLSGDEEKISFSRSVDIEHTKDPEIYQKAISSSKDASVIAVLSTRKEPSFVRIVDQDLKLIKSIEIEEKEVKDIAVSPNGKFVAYITDQEIHVINLETGEDIEYKRSPKNYSYTKVEFDTDSAIYIAVSLTSIKGALLLKLEITPALPGTENEERKETENELKFGKAKVITNSFSKITSLDIFNSDLIAVAGNDNSIIILSSDDFFVYKTLKNVHKFAITNIEFSPNGKYLLSSSAASTVNIYEIPDGIKTRLTWLWYALTALLISMVYYWLKSQITDAQWAEIDEWMHYLFDEPVELDQYGNVIQSTYYNTATPSFTDNICTENALTIDQLSTTIPAASEVEAVTAAIELSSIEAETALSIESIAVESEPAVPEYESIATEEFEPTTNTEQKEEEQIQQATETNIEVLKQIVIENGDIVQEQTLSIAHTTTPTPSSTAAAVEEIVSTAESISPEESQVHTETTEQQEENEKVDEDVEIDVVEVASVEAVTSPVRDEKDEEEQNQQEVEEKIQAVPVAEAPEATD